MKKRSRKIEKIVTLASSEECRAGVATGKSRQQLEQQLERLGELNAYRQGYAELSRSMGDLSSVHWKDYRSFMARLDQAVKAQQQIVLDSEQNLDMHRRRWTAKRQRLESLQRVLDSYRNAEYLHAERLEQRTLDDMPKAGDLFDEREDS